MAGGKSSLSFVFADFFGPTDRELFCFFCFFNIFWARNCFFCSRVVSLPRCSHQKLLTHSVSHRRRNLPQQPALAHTNTNNSKTDAQTFAPVQLKYVYSAHTNTRVHQHCVRQKKSITLLFQAAA